jgi:hypothetical protein
MRDRVWLSAGAVVMGILVFWGTGYVVSGNSGDQEFQKMLEATKQIKTFRSVSVASSPSGQQSGKLWEVDCNRGIIHKVTRDLQPGTSAGFDIKEDEFLVGLDRFIRQGDGSWQKTGDTHVIYSGKWYCDNIAQASLRDLLPDTRAMLRNAMIGKGDKKTVNGVRCQDWAFAMKSSTSGQKGTVCIGMEDHLPYEMTTDNGARYSYSDYNRPIELEAPEAVLQAASANEGSN